MKRTRPTATIAIAAVTAAAFLLASASGSAVQLDVVAGFIPARFSGLYVPGALPAALTPLTATLLHGSLFHVGINLLTLVFCGREDEAALGAGGTLATYAVSSFAAAATQYLFSPASDVPMIGASGAISGLVGAYAMLYGRRRPSTLHPELARWLHLLWLAAAWIGIQFLLAIASRAGGLMIAWPAHVGGFIAGVLLARPLLCWRYRGA